MARFSPKVEIINHFDNLINRVDIEIEKCLENYKEDQLLCECEKYEKESDFILASFVLSESTKVFDYLKHIRMRTIEELRKAQNDALEYYKLNSSSFQDQLKDGINFFNLFTIRVDFYMY